MVTRLVKDSRLHGIICMHKNLANKLKEFMYFSLNAMVRYVYDRYQIFKKDISIFLDF